MEYNKDIFASNLKHYMNRDKRSQADIMRLTGASQSAVSDWVNGRKFPRVDKIEMLANYFGVYKSDLIEDKSGMDEIEKYVRIISKNQKLKELIDVLKDSSDHDIETLISLVQKFKQVKI